MTNTETKDAALNELKAIEERTKQLRKIIEDAEKPKTVLSATNAEEALAAAIIYLGEEDEEVLTYRWMEKYQAPSHILSEQRCVLVCRALNEKKPLGSTTYTPYFDTTKKAGSGFYISGYAVCWLSGYSHDVCFRLHLNDRNHAIHAGTVMEKDYYNYLMKQA